MYYSTIIQSIGFVVYTIVVIFVVLLWGQSVGTIIGTCTIVNWYEKRKRKIATVKVVETGEVIKDVLIDGSLCEDENAGYTLYEICKLYYLKQMKSNKEKKNF